MERYPGNIWMILPGLGPLMHLGEILMDCAICVKQVYFVNEVKMNKSPIFSRTYDFVLWILPCVSGFPRTHRFGLGERVSRKVLDFQEMIIAAGLAYGANRITLLKQADVCLAQLRHLLRLCSDLKLMSIGQYEHVAKMLVEIGRLLGGWIKKMNTGVSR